MLEIVSSCDRRVFGLAPSERLRRQMAIHNRLRAKRCEPLMAIAATGCAVLDEAAIAWLFEHPGTLLGTPGGRPLAVAMPAEAADEARRILERGGDALPSGGVKFVRKLRRKVRTLAVSLEEVSVRSLEQRLYANAYKGVTDLVTKYVWPRPAYVATRLFAGLGIPPNAVTATGMLLMLLATYLFWSGEFAGGLAAAWGMTFLDTVDGKLARVTAQSSKLGNTLDHGTDILHPPLWWWAVTAGLIRIDPQHPGWLWDCFGVIFASYVISRVVEESFKRRFGINAFIWRRFDSRFRLVVARRNVILLFLTVGLLLGRLTESWIAVAVWGVVSLLIQLLRLGMARRASRAAKLRSWLA